MGPEVLRFAFQATISRERVERWLRGWARDLLAPGSSELRIVRDAEAVGGVQLSGLRAAPVSQSADFVKLFKGARSRLAQQHKPPAPSSV